MLFKRISLAYLLPIRRMTFGVFTAPVDMRLTRSLAPAQGALGGEVRGKIGRAIGVLCGKVRCEDVFNAVSASAAVIKQS